MSTAGVVRPFTTPRTRRTRRADPLPDVPPRRQKRIRQHRFWQAARTALALGDEDAAVHLLRHAVENKLPHVWAHYDFYHLRHHPEAREIFRPGG